MSHAHAVRPFVETDRAVKATNVVPLRAARVHLQIFLTGAHPEAQLASLLHSPIGVYVMSSRTDHDMIEVTFDIAHEDFDFTLHMLLSTVTEATVGSIVRQRNVTVQ
jgi:hypothetical protein